MHSRTLPTYSLLFGPSFKADPNLALIKCLSTLPEALVGRTHRWATMTLGSLKPARPWRRQKSCRSAAESLSVKGVALVLALAECGETRTQSALSETALEGSIWPCQGCESDARTTKAATCHPRRRVGGFQRV